MVGIVVSFFSWCDYALPKRHLASTLETLASAGVPVAFTQATAAKQAPQPAPRWVRSRVYENAGPLFLKENLWNLGADLLPECDKLAFIDSDVRLNDGWTAGVERVLTRVDVCQPFSRCRWLNRDGKMIQQKASAAKAISLGRAPWPHRAHPGFGLAMTRNTYDRIGGVYERQVAGGGDLAFWLAMSRHQETSAILAGRAKSDELNVAAPSYIAYRENALRHSLRVGYVDGVTATHLWHGDAVDRRYVTRERYFPRRENLEPAVDRRPDGLLAFTAPAPDALAYFQGRREDG
jgi:hypothetical protein